MHIKENCTRISCTTGRRAPLFFCAIFLLLQQRPTQLCTKFLITRCVSPTLQHVKYNFLYLTSLAERRLPNCSLRLCLCFSHSFFSSPSSSGSFWLLAIYGVQTELCHYKQTDIVARLSNFTRHKWNIKQNQEWIRSIFPLLFTFVQFLLSRTSYELMYQPQCNQRRHSHLKPKRFGTHWTPLQV